MKSGPSAGVKASRDGGSTALREPATDRRQSDSCVTGRKPCRRSGASPARSPARGKTWATFTPDARSQARRRGRHRVGGRFGVRDRRPHQPGCPRQHLAQRRPADRARPVLGEKQAGRVRLPRREQGEETPREAVVPRGQHATGGGEVGGFGGGDGERRGHAGSVAAHSAFVVRIGRCHGLEGGADASGLTSSLSK